MERPGFIPEALLALCSGALGLTCNVLQSALGHAVDGNFDPNCGTLRIRGQLQRSYINCLYIALHGGVDVIPPQLAALFRDAETLRWALNTLLLPYFSKLGEMNDSRMEANARMTAWIYRRFAENAGRKSQAMRSLISVVDMLMAGDEALDDAIRRTCP